MCTAQHIVHSKIKKNIKIANISAQYCVCARGHILMVFQGFQRDKKKYFFVYMCMFCSIKTNNICF